MICDSVGPLRWPGGQTLTEPMKRWSQTKDSQGTPLDSSSYFFWAGAKSFTFQHFSQPTSPLGKDSPG